MSKKRKKLISRQRVKAKKRDRRLKREKRAAVRKEKQLGHLIAKFCDKPTMQTLNVQTQFSRSAFKPPGNTQQATTVNRVLRRTEQVGFNKEAWQADPTTAQRPQSVVQPQNGFNAEAWKPNG